MGSDKPIACAVGTYNPTPYSQVAENCLKCPAGYYCALQGLSEPSGFSATYNVLTNPATNGCEEGFYCRESAETKGPASTDLIAGGRSYSRWGVCPVGHYCPKATGYPYKCPLGKYNDLTSGKSVADCKDCASGHYCGTIGLSVSTGSGTC